MDEVIARNRAAYDRIAEEFAARNPEVPAPYLAMADEFQRRADGPLLDLGCGPGRDLAYWAARGAAGVGLDLSAAMLRAARVRVAVPLVQGDLLRLPFRAGVFGGVWCSASLLHLPKAAAPVALAEVRRVLRPGGPLLLSLQAGDREGWEQWPGEEAARFFARYRPAEAEALLIAAGFRVLRRERDATPTGKEWLCHLAEVA
ncbi:MULTISPECIES: class I SAM-dependent methyltransferase [Micromonospora]|uniref:Class I SAM-dependent methyltransferase n=1 Tax=Micromonospora solifontis TaxID=2487138 RepID=A0ABX9WLC4_9ACTN|nr:MULTISPECIES: class I SAM-dependent methyltransferase [Micromonospora]NES14351.1 class I SAM-dependent methyltransferase [Micromonospora sp. PPF5-17B]NES35041.1 class I SAM-dependent methyltransferase [Micromonospora solifontis]NES57459.1 class I SAM-dependent methyltransferase [Micromonospora sp. PPF5-6]RNM01312.1 class I SAM-dependent methyltransferase [Micromonospora solifontis]